jgi:hypothetical protein
MGPGHGVPEYQPHDREGLMIACLLRSLFAAALIAPAVSAATYTVTGVHDSGPGSLRQAIIDANNLVGPDTIDFAQGVAGVVVLHSALPIITDDITIIGPGPDQLEIRRVGGGDYTVLQISGSGMDASISGLKITQGRTAGGGSAGGMMVTASGGTALISDCLFEGNTGGIAGGLAVTAQNLTVSDCTIRYNNTSAALGGGAGGLYFGASQLATVTRCTISHNSGSPGGVRVPGGQGLRVMSNCTISSYVASPG